MDLLDSVILTLLKARKFHPKKYSHGTNTDLLSVWSRPALGMKHLQGANISHSVSMTACCSLLMSGRFAGCYSLGYCLGRPHLQGGLSHCHHLCKVLALPCKEPFLDFHGNRVVLRPPYFFYSAPKQPKEVSLHCYNVVHVVRVCQKERVPERSTYFPLCILEDSPAHSNGA